MINVTLITIGILSDRMRLYKWGRTIPFVIHGTIEFPTVSVAIRAAASRVCHVTFARRPAAAPAGKCPANCTHPAATRQHVRSARTAAPRRSAITATRYRDGHVPPVPRRTPPACDCVMRDLRVTA